MIPGLLWVRHRNRRTLHGKGCPDGFPVQQRDVRTVDADGLRGFYERSTVDCRISRISERSCGVKCEYFASLISPDNTRSIRPITRFFAASGNERNAGE